MYHSGTGSAQRVCLSPPLNASLGDWLCPKGVPVPASKK